MKALALQEFSSQQLPWEQASAASSPLLAAARYNGTKGFSQKKKGGEGVSCVPEGGGGENFPPFLLFLISEQLTGKMEIRNMDDSFSGSGFFIIIIIIIRDKTVMRRSVPIQADHSSPVASLKSRLNITIVLSEWSSYFTPELTSACFICLWTQQLNQSLSQKQQQLEPLKGHFWRVHTMQPMRKPRHHGT